jgi:hypothetical protein
LRIAGSIAALFLLAACGASEDEPPRDDPQPKGHYVVDPETGATRASITNEDGTTILRAGDGSEGEVAELPTGFTVYPDAEIRSTVEVGRGERRSVTMTLASDAPPADMIAFYRAEAAGVAVDVELATDTLSMVGGRAEDGTHFTFQAAREEDETVGQLTVGQLSVDQLHGNRPRN